MQLDDAISALSWLRLLKRFQDICFVTFPVAELQYHTRIHFFISVIRQEDRIGYMVPLVYSAYNRNVTLPLPSSDICYTPTTLKHVQRLLVKQMLLEESRRCCLTTGYCFMKYLRYTASIRFMDLTNRLALLFRTVQCTVIKLDQ